MKWHFILSALFLPIPVFAAQQDLRRCIQEDGSIIFTDKSCSDSDIEKPTILNTPIATPLKRKYPTPPSCNRTADDLLYSVRTAVNMNDANLLARHYHWNGVSSLQAESILNRLELLVAKPLIDIRLLQSVDNINIGSISEIDSGEESPPASNRQSQAYAIKLVQYHSGSSHPQQSTVFKLQHYFDCYWIRY